MRTVNYLVNLHSVCLRSYLKKKILMQTIRSKSLKRAQGFNLLLLLDSAGGKLTTRLNISLEHVLQMVSQECLDVDTFFLHREKLRHQRAEATCFLLLRQKMMIFKVSF